MLSESCAFKSSQGPETSVSSMPAISLASAATSALDPSGARIISASAGGLAAAAGPGSGADGASLSGSTNSAWMARPSLRTNTNWSPSGKRRSTMVAASGAIRY